MPPNMLKEILNLFESESFNYYWATDQFLPEEVMDFFNSLLNDEKVTDIDEFGEYLQAFKMINFYFRSWLFKLACQGSQATQSDIRQLRNLSIKIEEDEEEEIENGYPELNAIIC